MCPTFPYAPALWSHSPPCMAPIGSLIGIQSRRRDSTNWRTTQSSRGGPRKRQKRWRAGDSFLRHGGDTDSPYRDLQERHQGRFECRRQKDPEETQRKLVGSTMDKKLFADLVESMQRHNEIIAGTRKPARTTKVDAQSIKVLRAKRS